MLPEARRRDLLRYLARHGSASINELSRRYHVSSMTIRRDLAHLQAAGSVTLTHGGAVFNAATETRRAAPSLQSHAIARYAAGNFVKHGDVLLLDGSDAALALPPWLKDMRDLTVASNSLAVVNALSEQLDSAAILCSGGLLQPKSGSLTGPLAERFFGAVFARAAFLSGDGLFAGWRADRSGYARSRREIGDDRGGGACCTAAGIGGRLVSAPRCSCCPRRISGPS